MKKKQRMQLIKSPQQLRSRQMVRDIREAAIRVLKKHPASEFNTIRVAKEAGISVGSLYQYYPSKGAILFAIQMEEWEETRSRLEFILNQAEKPPIENLQEMVTYFFQSEWEERKLRQSLRAVTFDLKTSREFKKLQSNAKIAFSDYLIKNFQLTKADSAFWPDFILVSITALAEEITSRLSTEKEVTGFAERSGQMILGYFQSRNRK